MDRTLPIGKMKLNQKGRACVSSVGIESIFADSCPKASSPYFLLGNYRCNLHGLMLFVWGSQFWKKCIFNTVIKTAFCCNNMLTLLLPSWLSFASSIFEIAVQSKMYLFLLWQIRCQRWNSSRGLSTVWYLVFREIILASLSTLIYSECRTWGSLGESSEQFCPAQTDTSFFLDAEP